MIADRRDTRDELLAYLDGAGLPAQGVDAPHKLARVTGEIVLFPDDFAAADIDAALPRLARAPLLVLITAEPQRYADATGRAPLVMPKPAFGWQIVDAIRAHREAP